MHINKFTFLIRGVVYMDRQTPPSITLPQLLQNSLNSDNNYCKYYSKYSNITTKFTILSSGNVSIMAVKQTGNNLKA